MATEIPNLFPALPELFLALAGMALLMFGVFRKVDASRLVGDLAALALVIAAALAIGFGGMRQLTFEGLYVTDAFAVFAKVMVFGSAAVTLWLAIRNNFV